MALSPSVTSAGSEAGMGFLAVVVAAMSLATLRHSAFPHQVLPTGLHVDIGYIHIQYCLLGSYIHPPLQMLSMKFERG